MKVKRIQKINFRDMCEICGKDIDSSFLIYVDPPFNASKLKPEWEEMYRRSLTDYFSVCSEECKEFGLLKLT